MKRTTFLAAGLLLALAAPFLKGQSPAAGAFDPQLTLPPEIFAVVGEPMKIEFANTVLGTPEQMLRLTYQVACDVGAGSIERWTLTATPEQVGSHPLRLEARLGEDGPVLGEASTTVRVAPREAGEAREISLLIIGDSLTQASLYPNELARLLSRPGNPRCRMLGTHRPAGVAEDVAHEGYGGWTWGRFLTQYDPKSPVDGRVTSSPFLFPPMKAGEPPVLNLPRYFQERGEGRVPDYITILLGINDCFGALPDDAASVEKTIDTMMSNAETLLAALRKAAPQAQIGVCLTPPGNARDAAFVANYQDKYTRWGWRRIQHRLVQRQIAAFRGRESQNIHLVPTELSIDCVAGYPENNGVHPNAIGYADIAASLYAWLKERAAHSTLKR